MELLAFNVRRGTFKLPIAFWRTNMSIERTYPGNVSIRMDTGMTNEKGESADV